MIKRKRQKLPRTDPQRLPVIEARWDSPSGVEQGFIYRQDPEFQRLRLRSELLVAIRGRWGDDDAALVLRRCSGATVADLRCWLARFNGAKSVAELLAL